MPCAFADELLSKCNEISKSQLTLFAKLIRSISLGLLSFPLVIKTVTPSALNLPSNLFATS